MGERDIYPMKIANVVITGEDGQRVELSAPVVLECPVGSCLTHGSDDGVVARCDACEKWICAGHWNEASGLCDHCEARFKNL